MYILTIASAIKKMSVTKKLIEKIPDSCNAKENYQSL